jgi:RNA polymerase sigma-70 factor (ECF subfamily)
VPNFADAEEIMQETCGVMWRKFHQFESGTDFTAWAIQIARYRILDYRRKRYKERLIYDSEIFERIIALAEEAAARDDRRLEALRRCLTKLRDRQSRLIRLRFYEGIKPKEIADREGMSIHAVYKTLSRIYTKLVSCVRRTLVYEG